MKPFKDIEKIKRMFATGQPTLIDTRTGYKYTMCAPCPKDGDYALVARIERAQQSLSKVIFQCPSCLTQFEVNQDEILVC